MNNVVLRRLQETNLSSLIYEYENLLSGGSLVVDFTKRAPNSRFLGALYNVGAPDSARLSTSLLHPCT